MESTGTVAHQSRHFSRLFLALQVAAIYFTLAVSLVCVVDALSLPLFSSEGGAPTFWLRLVQGFYYVVPVVISLFLGFLFRPFWESVFRFCVLVFLMQFSVSLAAYGLRDDYISRQQQDLNRSRLAIIGFSPFSHSFSDDDHDGTVDRVLFVGEIQAQDLPPGKYFLQVQVMQDQKLLPLNPAAVLPQDIGATADSSFKLQFSFDPQMFKPFFHKDLDVYLSLQKKRPIGPWGQRVVRLNRWIPFLRTTSWAGGDPIIQEKIEDLGISEKVAAFYLR